MKRRVLGSQLVGVALAAAALSQPAIAGGLPAPQKGDKILASGGPLLPASAGNDRTRHSSWLNARPARSSSCHRV